MTLPAIQKPTPMGGSAQIAFASMRNGHPQIYLMDLNTKEIKQITDINGGACQPSWSPKGDQLVFTSPCNNDKEMYDNSGLFIINADGTGLVDLNSPIEGDYDPDWSPDGKKIAMTSLRDGNRHIYILDLDTREAVGLSGKNSHEFQPNWSPDGQLIAFTTILSGPKEVWTMTADGSDRKVFSRVMKGDCLDPLWSPDMKSILFTHYAGSDNRAVIKTARWLDGGIERGFKEVPIIDLSATTREPDFSQDGYWIVFVSSKDPGNLDIFLMRANGADFQRLTTDPAKDFDPAWRPGIPTQ
jgi:Tol biopolymer transport system component